MDAKVTESCSIRSKERSRAAELLDAIRREAARYGVRLVALRPNSTRYSSINGQSGPVNITMTTARGFQLMYGGTLPVATVMTKSSGTISEFGTDHGGVAEATVELYEHTPKRIRAWLVALLNSKVGSQWDVPAAEALLGRRVTLGLGYRAHCTR